jgi:hypothetical protein
MNAVGCDVIIVFAKRKQNKGKNAEYKHQTENAVDWKCLFATVNVDLIIAIYRL